MSKPTLDARDVQQTRGVLAVVVMLLLAGVVMVLFAAGTLSNGTTSKRTNEATQTLITGERN